MRRDSTFIASKPATKNGEMSVSPPPASIARASPRRMMSAAVPMASVPAAQAVQVAVTGPRRPSSIDTWPAPMFATLWGIANGDTRSMPRSSITRCCSSREMVPEPPLPMIVPIPAPSWSIGSPESWSARRPAATASCA